LFFAEVVQIVIELVTRQFAGITPRFWYRIAMGIGNLLALALLYSYNGQRGRKMKYCFYIIYPLHFALLVVAAHLVGMNLPLFPF
jgi:hypothetical protein